MYPFDYLYFPLLLLLSPFLIEWFNIKIGIQYQSRLILKLGLEPPLPPNSAIEELDIESIGLFKAYKN